MIFTIIFAAHLSAAITARSLDTPHFTEPLYKAVIWEDFTNGSMESEIVVEPPVHAIDENLERNASVRYAIIGGNEEGFFNIETLTGSLSLVKPIERETLESNSFSLLLKASISDQSRDFSIAVLHVNVLNIGQQVPSFENAYHNISIVENLPNGFSVLKVAANNQEKRQSDTISYRLIDPGGAFTIDPQSGWLIVANHEELDREKKSHLRVAVASTERIRSWSNSTFVLVDIYLIDSNDNNPSFIPTNTYHFSIDGATPQGSIIGQVKAVDIDDGNNGDVLYSIEKCLTNPCEMFSINPDSGEIMLMKQLMSQDTHTILVQAMDQATIPSERRGNLAVVQVTVTSLQGSVPGFVGSPYEFHVNASAPLDAVVGRVRVRGFQQEDVLFTLRHNMETPSTVPFSIEPKSGILRVTGNLGTARIPLYQLEILATDGFEQISTNATVNVMNLPSARNPRQESASFAFAVSENLPNAFVGHIAYPQNGPETERSLRFSLLENVNLSEMFTVLPNGSIFTQNAIDFETNPNISLLVTVEDEDLGRVIDTVAVSVLVLDADEQPPEFSEKLYVGNVQENSPVGTPVKFEIPVKINGDLSKNLTLQLEGINSELFSIDKETGQVFTATVIDRETASNYTLKMVARDLSVTATAEVIVFIEDVNDNVPEVTEFIPGENITVIERTAGENNGSLNLCINKSCVLSADDSSVTSGRSIGTLSKFRTGLQRILTEILDAAKKTDSEEADDDYDYDGSFEEALDGALKNSSFLIQVPENLGSNRFIGQFVADDKDARSNLLFQLENENEIFSLDPVNGTLTAREKLDSNAVHVLSIRVIDEGGLESMKNVTVEVVGSSNRPPKFELDSYEFTIPEGFYDQTPFEDIVATEEDEGENGRLTYRIISNQSLPFSVEERTGTIIIRGLVDREKNESFSFQVEASDNGVPSLKANTGVTFLVKDTNDNAPQFIGVKEWMEGPGTTQLTARLSSSGRRESLPLFEVSIDEKLPVNTFVISLSATDEDIEPANRNISYRLESHHNQFWINPRNGSIYTKTSLAFEKSNEYNVIAVAMDDGVPRLSSTAVVRVSVNQVPCIPVSDAFKEHFYNLNIKENLETPFALLNLTATNGVRILLESGDTQFFRFESTTLWLLQSPDRENTSSYDVTLRVDQTGPNLCKRDAHERIKIKVNIIDVNDNAPHLDFFEEPVKIAVSPDIPVGKEVYSFTAIDSDEGINAKVKYSMESDFLGNLRFSIDPGTGQLFVSAPLTNDGGKIIHLVIKATDRDGGADGLIGSLFVTIHVVDRSHQVAVVFGSRTDELSSLSYNISNLISHVSGMEVWVQSVEPHLTGDIAHAEMSDVIVYAVNSTGRNLISSDFLSRILQSRMDDISRSLHPYRPKEVRVPERISSRIRMNPVEVTLVAVGVAILLGTVVAVVCIVFGRKNLKKKAVPSVPTAMEYHLQRTRVPRTYHDPAVSREPYLPMNRPESTSDYVELPESRDKSRHYYYCSARLPCPSCETHGKGVGRDGSRHHQCHCCGRSLDKSRRGHPPISEHRCPHQRLESIRNPQRNLSANPANVHESHENPTTGDSFQREISSPGHIRINYIQNRQADCSSVISEDTFEDSLQSP